MPKSISLENTYFHYFPNLSPFGYKWPTRVAHPCFMALPSCANGSIEVYPMICCRTNPLMNGGQGMIGATTHPPTPTFVIPPTLRLKLTVQAVNGVLLPNSAYNPTILQRTSPNKCFGRASNKQRLKKSKLTYEKKWKRLHIRRRTISKTQPFFFSCVTI